MRLASLTLLSGFVTVSLIKSCMKKLEIAERDKLLAVTDAVVEVEKRRDALRIQLVQVEKERDFLSNQLEQAIKDSEGAMILAETKLSKEIQVTNARRESEIADLKAKLESFEISKELAINQAVNDVAKERDQLKNGLDRVALQKQLSEKALRNKYETQIKDREEAI